MREICLILAAKSHLGVTDSVHTANPKSGACVVLSRTPRSQDSGTTTKMSRTSSEDAEFGAYVGSEKLYSVVGSALEAVPFILVLCWPDLYLIMLSFLVKELKVSLPSQRRSASNMYLSED